MAACGPKTSSPASPAICWPRRCCASKPPAIAIVLHVHDEIVAEVPIGCGSVDEFTQLMTRKPSLGAGPADRSQRLDWSALLQMKGGRFVPCTADTRFHQVISNLL